MPKLRNPGLYSFLIFLVAAALVVVMFVRKADDAPRLATELVGVAIAAFGAKSALETKGRLTKTTTATVTSSSGKTATATVETRAKSNTWPEITPAGTIDVELVEDEKKKEGTPS